MASNTVVGPSPIARSMRLEACYRHCREERLSSLISESGTETSSMTVLPNRQLCVLVAVDSPYFDPLYPP